MSVFAFLSAHYVTLCRQTFKNFSPQNIKFCKTKNMQTFSKLISEHQQHDVGPDKSNYNSFSKCDIECCVVFRSFSTFSDICVKCSCYAILFLRLCSFDMIAGSFFNCCNLPAIAIVTKISATRQPASKQRACHMQHLLHAARDFASKVCLACLKCIFDAALMHSMMFSAFSM